MSRTGRPHGRRQMIFLLPAPQPRFKIWAATRRCHPHLGVLPASIKAIRTLLQLRLPAQLFLICNKLTLKPTITSTGRECLHLGNLPTPASPAPVPPRADLHWSLEALLQVSCLVLGLEAHCSFLEGLNNLECAQREATTTI